MKPVKVKPKKPITTKEAVDQLRKALKEDSQYYYAWQSNIAVQFQDHFRQDCLHKGVHEISNNAAKAFLDLLLMERNKRHE
jgi:hypothetical protein